MITVIENQNPLDVAIQEGGDISAVFSLAQINEISITDNISAGDHLTVDGIEIGSKEVLDYYQRKLLMPATGQTSSASGRRLIMLLLKTPTLQWKQQAGVCRKSWASTGSG